MALLVKAEGLHKVYGDKLLFEEADFDIYTGDRIGLIGANGCGKTTLFNILLGRISTEGAELTMKEDIRVRYVDQDAVAKSFGTVGEFLEREPPQVGIQILISEEEAKLADPDVYETGEFQDITTRIQELKTSAGWTTAGSRKKSSLELLSKLRCPEITADSRVEKLSGGERQKVALASVLSNPQQCDLLLLDEPTNHLDIQTIEWLEERLDTFPGAVLMVSHDRYLLDGIVKQVLEMEGGRITPYQGTYSEYEAQKAQRDYASQQARKKAGAEIRRREASIQTMKSRNKYDSQIKSKIIQMKKVDRPDNALMKQYMLKFRFKSKMKSGKDVAYGKYLDKSFGGNVLLDSTEFEIYAGQKIGLIGPNGCGKTTLLKMIAGEVDADDGDLYVSPGVKAGYFDQGHLLLELDNTLIEEVRRLDDRIEEPDAKALLGQFNFRGEKVHSKVSSLSGGERARLSLLRLIFQPYNLLMLDEPTNHMDIPSKLAIGGALNAFDGTVIIVSHDRYFLDNVVDRIFHLDDGTIRSYKGNYTDFAGREKSRVKPTSKSREWVVQTSFKNWALKKKFKQGDVVNITDENKHLFDWAIKTGAIKLVEKK